MVALTKNERWRNFRAEVIELDGDACVRCGRTRKDGAVFHVHHKKYIKGCLPWEHPYTLCETLCSGCHASEHGIRPPKTGWEFLDEEDLGDLCGNCEYCGTEIRYVFYVYHPSWDPLGVGTNCCDNLTGTETASNHVKLASRRKRFVTSPRWEESNGVFSIQQKRINVYIQPTSEGFQIQMNDQKGKKLFPTAEEAKKAAFDVIESGKAEEYFCKKSIAAKR